jgi:hypothetical protein
LLVRYSYTAVNPSTINLLVGLVSAQTKVAFDLYL